MATGTSKARRRPVPRVILLIAALIFLFGAGGLVLIGLNSADPDLRRALFIVAGIEVFLTIVLTGVALSLRPAPGEADKPDLTRGP
jgi:hypothetical protein